VDILVIPQHAGYVDAWIPLRGKMWMLRLKLIALPVFDTGLRPHSSALYSKFVEDVSNALRRVEANETTIPLGDFNTHVGNDLDADGSLNDNRILMLQLYFNTASCSS